MKDIKKILTCKSLSMNANAYALVPIFFKYH